MIGPTSTGLDQTVSNRTQTTMNQILTRYRMPRLDLFNAGGNRVTLNLPAIATRLPAQKWLYARVECAPAVNAVRINPVTHALTGCTGLVDGSKSNMSKIAYLFAAAEAIEDDVGMADWVGVNFSSATDTVLAMLRRDIVNNHPAWVELVNSAGDGFAFTGTETMLFTLAEADPNLRLHLLMGCLQ